MPYPNPNDTIPAGRKELAVITRRFFSQAKQPKWLKLSQSLYLEPEMHLHSSQISGFANGKLKDPSPKAFVALGHLNLSLVASLRGSFTYEGIGDVPKLPEDLRYIWGGMTPMVDPEGQPLGPVELFEINCGFLKLGLVEGRTIPTEHEAAAAKAVGKALRLGLAAQGRDFLEELPALRAGSNLIEPLLMGKTVPGVQLVDQLAALADAAGVDEDELWLAAQATWAEPA